MDLTSGSIWLRDVDERTGWVIVEGDHADDGSELIQVGRAAGDDTNVLVVLPGRRELTKDEKVQIINLLRDRFAQAPVAFVVDDAEGRAVVVTSDRPSIRHEVAAAVTVIKASWAWDESEEFDISVNGTRYTVEAAYDDRTWHAEVIQIVEGGGPAGRDRGVGCEEGAP